MVAMGDLNSDGIPDLVFQNTAGVLVGWLMNGAGMPMTGVTIYAGGLGSWKVGAMKDLNPDGIPDLIFQNTAGALVGWLMNGAGLPSIGVTIYGGALGDWRVR